MTELADRLAKLTPAQRRLLELRRAQQSGAAPAADSAAIPARGEGPAPLSFAQRRLWFLDRMEPGNAFYNLPNAVRLRGALDVPALERTLGEIVRRHEALRTVFAEADGSPVQVIVPFGGFALPVEDLSGLGDEDREASAGHRVREEAGRSFDLSAGPLFRAALLRLGAEEHVLLLTMHHIVSDGWSTGVLLRELSALYSAYREGRESPLSELPVQYADFAAWQREQLAGEVLDRQLAYWKERLSGAPELLELPTDHPRPAVQTYRGATVPVELSPELLERLQALGRSEGATLYMVLLGAFQVLLSKYSGSEDVVVGSPIAGRTRKEVEELIGLFVNTLVLRTDLSGDPSFRETLRRAREVTLGAYAHQEVPFEELVAELRPERSLSHSPLFQVLFALQNAGGQGGALQGLSMSGAGAEHATAQFDLSLELAATPQGLRGGLNYSTDLFERGTVERMIGHLARVLEQVAADADAPLSRLALAGPEERARVVVEWNRTERPFPREASIHALFKAQAERTPRAVALVWGAEELTYREVDARANRLAHHLAALGVGPESRVGLRVERSVENVVATLAVLKAGGCCVPVDTSYPAERMELMLADSGVRVLLSDGDLDAPPAGSDLHVIRLDQVAEVLAAEADHAPPASAAAESLAYVFYTSGSTGRPKGVMMGHREVVQYALGLPGTMPIGPGDRVAQASNASFDAAVFEIWGALLHGATLVGIDRDVLLSAPLLGRALRELGITHLYQTAALFSQHVREQVDVYASLRQLVFGAEAVGTESVRRMLREGKPARVLHEYGPTEATVWCTLEEVEEVAEDAPTVLIGRPIPNARGYVLDPAGEPLPVGVPGELCIGGAGVVRGYLGRPGLTAERFVPDPFAAEPGGRMYRTGDRARWRAEGKLEFLGRVDDQVKIRGFRIEPGEVEAAISAYPGVREARVMMREDQPGDKRLVAYVVGSMEIDGLRAHLRQGLPEYMVPQAIVALDRLPLNANGKVDRKALPVPEYAADADRYVAPRTPTEEVLAGIWAEVLRLERVGVEESFFEVGGHSLLATRVVSRIRAVFGVELPLRALFERPVLSGLAAEIDRLHGTGAAAGEGAIAPAAREGDLPATFAQERLWFVDALDPGSPAYVIPFSYRLTGRLDHDALRRALTELVRRHEPLRTTLPAVDGVPVQRIAPPPSSFDLPVADLRHLPEDERRAEAGRLAAEASRHFDLARGPLFRASLVRLADAEHHLLLNLHHAIGDGWSMGVLLEELSALYGAFSRGLPSPLPEPALQYADYAVWQRARLSGAALERQVEFWRRALDGAPALLELPADRPRPPVESHRGAIERLVVPSGLAAEVHALARREGATLFMVLLSGLDVVLGRLAGQEDVVVGTPIAGRTRAETDRMVGLFLNSLALRTDLSGDPSFRELLGRVRESTLAAYAHQDLPFERVLEEVRPERSLAHAPVFQVMLNFLNFQRGAFGADGLEVAGAATGGEVSSKFDLTLYVGERDGGIDVSLVYAADLFDAPRMRGLLAQLEGVLRQAAAAPETRVGALSLATEAARGVLLDPARPIEAGAWGGAVHETFAARATESPEALAISDGAETWTYAELDAAANRIAHRLIDGGVRPGDVVAVYAHRSAALVRALLGTWKAGAAFAVLDPAYPPARLAAQAGAARPTALLRISAAGEVPAEVAAALDESARTTVVLPAGKDDGLGGFPSAAPAVSVAADDLAYVAFTSGTTGTPKAIAGTHRPLAHFFGWYAREFGLGAEDRFSLLSGLAHDPLLRDVFAPLTTGGRIVIPDPDQVGTPGWLAGWMRDSGVTVAHLTPAMGQVLATGAGDAQLPALRLACFGGDVLRAADVERLRAAAPNAEAVNFYGATETPQAMGFFRLPADLAGVGPAVPVGRGIDGVDLLVISPSGGLAGVGELGEIAVRTPYLARGYLNDAELTASRFVANPITGDPADRVYRTGDLGRYRPDGEVEPVGRADQQVKVRGFRVELGEVESALAAHPAIREAAVMARETGAGDRLAAYWVPVEGSVEPDAASLRLHLKALLPEYMVPSDYVRLDRLPLTANGKLDRRALPEPEPAAADSRPAAPRTPTEEILAQIWAEVLRVESVGVDDDFFALGGHSLLATRLLARVQNALGVVLPLRAVFEGPTVAALATRVEEMRRAGLPVLPPVGRVDRDRPLPLSFAQERLWFLDRLEGGSASYNIPAALRLTGALDERALERSLGEIIRRHESLRTAFREVDGGAAQVIAPFAGFALPVEDLSALSDAAREAEVRRRAREDAARPFDLTEGPLVRAALLRLADEEHVLLLCIHHIVSDGWSSGVLFRELGALYAAYREGSDSPLAELPVQYADYAVWQREQLRGEVLDRHLAYWKERLAGAPALLELPTDRPRPPVQSHRGAREMLDLPRALLDRLQALGRSEGATLYMVLLSAFQLLLSKYSGSEDIVVGSPIAGRTRREVEELIGFFANTLVLRTDLSADPTFRELLGRVREGTLGAYEHQEVPFERLVAELQPERSLSHAPLFQVMFILHNVDRSGSGLAGLRMEGVVAESETTKFDLALTAIPHDGGIGGALEYSADLFNRSTVRRMLGHLRRVLEEVAADADVRLSELDLLSAEERGLVLEEWNRTEAEYPADRCIHELFEAQAARTPDAVAVEFEGEAVDYRTLNERANRLAHHLAGLGVGPETRVGICLERGTEMIVSVLAVLKAGGAYVPLDPAYPAERLAFVLSDAAVPVLVTQESLRAALSVGDGVSVVSVDGDRARIAAESAENPERGARPDHLAYVIYTSGSTGTPKGVMVPHRGVPNLAYAQARRFGIDGGSRVLQFASPSFDAAVAELFDALLTGATLVLASREDLLPGAGLLETLRRGRVTVATLPPSVLAILPPDGLPELCTVVSAGEAVDAATVERWSAGRTFVNAYGPTEITVCATSARCEADGRAPAIGRPLENVRVYVLDAAGRPAPVGIPGELCVGGVGVVRGYLGRPGLTAEKFVPDPFGGAAGGRLYRTGDRVRWRECESARVREGERTDVGSERTSIFDESQRTFALSHSRTAVLEYLGRLDEQVKVRGFRIEPGEVEAALRRHAGVRECIVVVREDASGGTRLVGYVVGEADPGSLREHLRQSLPDYMVPSAFVVLDALPLTPNGKIDRRALPAPELGAGEDRAAPRTPTEEILAGIWSELLGMDGVGADDDFFALGGHSLLATRFVSKIREVFGVEMAIRTIFEDSVLSALAARVDEALRADEGVRLPPLLPREGGEDAPLSFSQERLWLLQRITPRSPAYKVPTVLRFGGALDAGVMERVVAEIIRRHHVLRTVIVQEAAGPVQRVASTDFHLPLHDFSSLPADRAEAEARELARREWMTPFEIEGGVLFRAILIRIAADDHVLHLAAHHTVFDGWSAGVFQRELVALYDAFSKGEPSPLAGLPVQYADYAAWQRGWMTDEAAERQVDYWRGRLDGAPPLLELPTDRPRPAVQGYRAGAETIGIAPGLLAGVRALARREGATPFMVLLAALDVVLSRWSGQEDLVIGTQVAGRTHAGTEPLIGVFLNTLAIRADLSGAPSFRELLARVREATLGAYAHQDVPFERVLDSLRLPRSLGHSPVFQVMVNYQNFGAASPAPAGLEPRPFIGAEPTSKVDMTLYAGEGPQGMGLALAYSAELFEAPRMRELLAQVTAVLEQAVADAGRSVAGMPLRTPEAAAILPDPSEPLDRAWRGSVPEIFARRAKERPDALAVADPRERWTYAELDAATARIARRLVEGGVRPGDTVTILAHRSAAMVRAMVGVLRAGAAFVALDPAYPPVRLAEYVRIAGPRGFLRIAAAGAVPSEVEEALSASVLVKFDLGGKSQGSIDDIDGLGSLPTEAPVVEIGADSLAYLSFTSGTTGAPKSVMGRHGSLTHFTPWLAERFSLAEEDRFSLLSGLAHDPLHRDVFTPLQLGASIIAPDPAGVGTPGYLGRWMAEAEVTVAHLTPAMGQLLADTSDRDDDAAGSLPSLRRAFFVGDVLVRGDVARLRRLAPNVTVVNYYGSTETQRAVSYHVVDPNADTAKPIVPLGRGIPGAQLLVRAANGALAGIGELGEVWLRSPHVALGYKGDAELTAARFVPNPWTGDAGDGMYRTGDLGRYGPDGEVEPAGRADQQVKVRGFRIELGEVEAALAKHAAVREAIVMARGEGDAKRLVAWLTSAGERPATREMREHLRALLPDFMVPSAFVWLDALPLTPNGKVDRRALPDPASPATAAPAAPRTVTERVIVEIWMEVLGVENVGVEDDFFVLGGHSLRATQVLARIAQRLEVGLPLRVLFETPTVAGLAAAVEAAVAAAADDGGAIADALAELDGLSDEEVAALLAEMGEQA